MCVCILSEIYNFYAFTSVENKRKRKSKIPKTQIKTKKRNERRKLSTSSLSKNNDRFIKNLSKANLTDNQIKLLFKGLKFIPTATVTKNKKTTAPTLARLQRFHKANALEIHFSRAKQINTSLLCQIKLGTAFPTISHIRNLPGRG